MDSSVPHGFKKFFDHSQLKNWERLTSVHVARLHAAYKYCTDTIGKVHVMVVRVPKENEEIEDLEVKMWLFVPANSTENAYYRFIRIKPD